MKELFENNKKIILFVLLPLICVVLIIFIVQKNATSEEPKGSGSTLNTSMEQKKDSIYGSRAAAYDDKDKEARAAKEKADFGTNTDVNFRMNDTAAKTKTVSNSTTSKQAAETDKVSNDVASIISENNKARAQNERQQARTASLEDSKINKEIDDVDAIKADPQPKKHSRGGHTSQVKGSAGANTPAVASNGFQNLEFDGGSTGGKETKGKNVIHASVLRSVRLAAGQDVTIRTTEAGSVGGVIIPRNSIISGITQMNTNRLMVRVTGVNIGGEPTRLQMTVFDQDGMEGIRAPGSAAGTAANQSVNDQVDAVDAKAAAHSGVVGLISSAGSSLVKAMRGSQKTYLPEGYKVTLMFSL